MEEDEIDNSVGVFLFLSRIQYLTSFFFDVLSLSVGLSVYLSTCLPVPLFRGSGLFISFFLWLLLALLLLCFFRVFVIMVIIITINTIILLIYIFFVGFYIKEIQTKSQLDIFLILLNLNTITIIPIITKATPAPHLSPPA